LHVWLARCGRSRDCQRMTCNTQIDTSLAMVVGRLDGRQVYWHKQCWIDDAEMMLSPYQVPKRGRRPLDISPAKRATRDKILRAMANYRYQLRKLDFNGGSKLDSITRRRLELDIEILSIKLEEYGGSVDRHKEIINAE